MIKKKLAARLYDRIFGSPKTHKRTYAAARMNRQNADWSTQTTSANWEIRVSGRALRARARQAARDNSHFKKFLDLVRSNLIGPKGLQLQSNARRADNSLNVEINKQVEDAFGRWCHRETCTVSGKLDWLGVQRLIVTHLARDGEFLVQKIAADNEFGFSLKVINVDYLDEMYNDTLPNGNRVIMSVEVDANDKPVTYWLTTPANEIMFAVRQERRRIAVPASEIIHGFLTFDDESQVRGVTWFHAALLDAKNFQSYREGVIQSARMASNTLGFLEQVTPDETGGTYTGTEDDETGAMMSPEINVSPLSMNELPPGYKLNQFDPKQPTQNHPAFSKNIEGTLATGLGVTYFELAGDMEAVNFSSARVGLDASREIWRGYQDFVAAMFCREVFHAWARASFFSGALKMSAKDFREIQNPMWRARGWKYIDPVKDVNADVTRLENNLTTWTDVLAEQGVDLTDYLQRRKSEMELAAQYGIELKAVTKVTATDQNAPSEDTPPAAPPKRYLNGHDDEELVN